MSYKQAIFWLLIGYAMIANLFFALGFYQGRMGKVEVKPVSICTQSKGDVYNVIMLRNCLQKLSVK